MTDYADWQKNMIADIRANGRPTSGYFEGRPVLVLTTTGAKTGKPRTVIVSFSRDGDDYVVVGSKSGEPDDPAWFTNLVANPVVTVETDRKTTSRPRRQSRKGPTATRSGTGTSRNTPVRRIPVEDRPDHPDRATHAAGLTASPGSGQDPGAVESEVDEVVEGAVRCHRRGAQHRPLVHCVGSRDVLQCPIQIGQAEGSGSGDSGKLVVVKDDDSTSTHQSPEVDEVEKHAVKSVIAVYEGQVKSSTLEQEARKRSLGLFGVVFDHPDDARLSECLQPEVGESRGLIRVDDHVTSFVVPVSDKSLAHEQRGDPIPETDLDGAHGVFAHHPAA